MKISGKKAFSLLELTIAVIILGILAAYGVPRFQAAMEQSRVDLAAAYLESIWTAQRLYKAKTGDFAAAMTDLNEFLDPAFSYSIQTGTMPFVYTTYKEDFGFRAKADRHNSTSWSGYIIINDSGTLQGGTTSTSNISVAPAKQ